MAAMQILNNKTNVRFKKRSDEADFVYFRSTEVDQNVCQSYLGRKGGMQETLLHSTCSTGQILHELLHTLGFVHEHSREDRDSFISIHWDNILIPQKNQFQMLPKSISIPVPIEFDFKSVLLYPANAFSMNGNFTITKKDESIYFANRSDLSELDVRRVNLLYGNQR
jgi:hypothetical protein